MDTYQQTKKVLSETKNVLICLPKHANPDKISAALALKKILATEKRIVEIVSPDFLAPHNLKFLEAIETIQPNLPGLKQLVINLDTSKTSLKEINHNTTENGIEIFIEPTHGIFEPQDITIKSVDYKYGLIITIGVTGFESLGEVFQIAPDFFYTIPIINIDYKPNNERFGQINIIETNKLANSEVIYDLFKTLEIEELIDQKIATQLLTGIISETNGFKSSKIYPAILEKISQLIKHDVNIPEINRNLFHAKSINMLKLWGRILARLKEEKNLQLLWSLIPYEDFTKTGSSVRDLPQIINELLSTYAEAQLIFLLWQNKDLSIGGLLKTTHRHNALELTNSFLSDGSSDLAQFSLPTNNLVEAESHFIQSLSSKIKNNREFI